MMRIITGSAKGVRLATLDGENTRPTTERAKEAVFSMLQFDIEGRRVLDLFAGSGQMGLEALSRGAASAVMVDHAKAAVDIIRKNIEKTKLEGASVVCSDALEYLRKCRRSSDEKFDIVFIDPPYAEKVIPTVLGLLLEGRKIKRTALIVCESGSYEDVFGKNASLAERFEIIRTVRHGISHITLLTPKKGDGEENE